MGQPSQTPSDRELHNHLYLTATALTNIKWTSIMDAVSDLRMARAIGAHVWIVGNGGSASTASHFANDLIKMAGVQAVSIPDMMPTILAYGNDTSWENMFAGVMRRLAKSGDVLVAISCSGHSENVLAAAKEAIAMNISIIVLTGRNGNLDQNPLAGFSLNPICVESDDIRIQESCHLAVCHAIAGLLKTE